VTGLPVGQGLAAHRVLVTGKENSSCGQPISGRLLGLPRVGRPQGVKRKGMAAPCDTLMDPPDASE
jgi:hypothetical protein